MDTKRDGRRLELEPGYMTAFNVRVIPGPKLTLEAPRLKLSKRLTTVELSGKSENLDDGVACQVTVIIKETDKKERREPLAGKLSVSNGTAKLPLEIDAAMLKLVGSGSLGFEVRPSHLYPPTVTIAPGPVTYDNPVSFAAASPSTKPLLGTLHTVTIAAGGCFKDSKIKVQIFESDANEGAATGRSIVQELPWAAGNRDPLDWRVGCASADEEATFVISQPGERGGFELGYVLGVDDGEEGFVELIRAETFLEIPRPKIEAFDLRTDKTTLVGEAYIAEGKVSGLDPDLAISFEITLDACGDRRPSTAGVEEDGTFKCVVMRRFFDTTPVGGLTALLTCKALDPNEPLSAVFEYDDKRFMPTHPRAHLKLQRPDDLRAFHLRTIYCDTNYPELDDRIDQLLPGIVDAMKASGIDTPVRMIHFLAQMGHESGRLRYMVEQDSGNKYEGRVKNLGNTQKGDGPRFKGRGLMQLTGRYNYTQYEKYKGEDFTTEPNNEKVEREPYCTDSAAWYWAVHRRGTLEAADQDDVTAVTKAVNGGTNGLDDRITLTEAARGVFGVKAGVSLALSKRSAPAIRSRPLDAPPIVEPPPHPYGFVLRLGDNDKAQRWGGSVREQDGAFVKALQQDLFALGYLKRWRDKYEKWHDPDDGDFGTGSDKAVKAYQKAKGRSDTGHVDELTADDLKADVAAKKS